MKHRLTKSSESLVFCFGMLSVDHRRDQQYRKGRLELFWVPSRQPRGKQCRPRSDCYIVCHAFWIAWALYSIYFVSKTCMVKPYCSNFRTIAAIFGVRFLKTMLCDNKLSYYALRVFTVNEPTHGILALIALRKLNLQTRMRSNPLGRHVWYLVRPFVYFHTLCVRTAKAAQSRLSFRCSPMR